MKQFSSINPYTGQLIESFLTHTQSQIENKLLLSEKSYKHWKQTPYDKRAEILMRAASRLRNKKKLLAACITSEMGKPITESYAEIEKCAWVCEYYAQHAARFLQDELIETDADLSYVKYQPLGPVLAIMPWNYPFWQVFRFAAPALMAGNTCILKHAPNVLRCALHIEFVLTEAGLPEGVFQNVIADIDMVPFMIEHRAIKAVTLTGSEAAGASVAALAGRNIKKTVLELGGSNAFVVLRDADLEAAVRIGVQSRMLNNGQSCIAAKRFIVVREVADVFTELFIREVDNLKSGDPMDENVQITVLARVDLAEKLEKQLQGTLQQGAQLLQGGKRSGTRFSPAVITGVLPGMIAFEEELFGPVAPIIVADSVSHALHLVNQSRFGLGVSVFTNNQENIQLFIDHAEDGAVYVNTLVKSDPRLPFGGTKKSGYGRELSLHGIREFVNIKTVFVKKI
jgi:succinate-semialdehyde dehydrogenase/glutarate-semialdehyde dehydrogenase